MAMMQIAATVTAFVSFTAMLAAEPLFEKTDVFIAGEDNVAQYRIPALVTTNEGTLLAICDARVDRPGDAPNNIDLVLKRSTDAGKTWGPLEVIIDLPDQLAAGDACALVDRQTGAVWIIYDHVYPNLESMKKDFPELPPGTHAGYAGRVIRLHAIKSEDDGHTWSEPLDLTPMIKDEAWIAAMSAPGMGIQTRDGRLVAPGYHRLAADTFDADHAHLMYSEDHGKTWHVTTSPGGATNECQVVELADGSLMLNMRSRRRKGCRAVAVTRDWGKTWSEIVDDATLIEPVCQASFIRYTDTRDGYARNRLLFANPASTKARENMTVRLSYDEGKTWPVSKVVDPGPAAYSCLTVLPDGTIGLLYESENYGKITFVRFNLEWLTDGNDTLTKQP